MVKFRTLYSRQRVSILAPHSDACVREGETERDKRTKIPKEVDTSATFTILPRDLLEEIGVIKVPGRSRPEWGDERAVDADFYAVVIAVEDREGATLTVTFAGVRPVLSIRSLEDLELKLDPVKGSLEATRPPGVAFYY